MSHTSISSTTEKVADIELANDVNGTGDIEDEKEHTTSIEDAGEHPKGFRLAMVILALVLSVFLVSLDMASLLLHVQDSQC
jgi:MFS transporter, DHA2 family, glioxin efflux transporter